MLVESCPDGEAARRIAAENLVDTESFAPPWADASRVLFQGTFDQLWEVRCKSILETVSDLRALEPLVLLPDDIQFDHYRSRYETLYGDAALDVLASLTMGETDIARGRFIFIDLEPVMLALSTEFDIALHRLLHSGRHGLPMVGVATSRPECIAVTGFDHLTDQTMPGRDSGTAHPSTAH
ncbi:hypothetical protein [Leucobacter manosquensis]|uniref:Uncharacterized protein n=1 Tax=Leucobacter manosquensis TaxID=2810611 RepID=A0ABS5M4V9_9MICO|nr:hypothetical protein [Leucobacter manosquensis]MBS3182227.1 hypothetical protein [Leucobacter manosquensis]